MIVRDKTDIFALLFATRGSVLPKIAPRIIGLSSIAAGYVWLDTTYGPMMHTGASAFAVFGVALSLFLGFRNNAAYDRWWESRKLWGQLIADLRSLGRETDIFVGSSSRRQAILRGAIGFMHLHRLNLRGLSRDAAAERWIEPHWHEAAHPPCAMLDHLASELTEARTAGEIDGFGAKALTERLASITLAQAGCERIANTPLPYVYSLLVFRTTWLYCLLLPVGIVDSAGWLTPAFTAVVAYVFFGLAEVTEELGKPFGKTVNGLPLDAMCRTVEISIAPHLGEAPPERLKPQNYYLS
ncbi:bestrophin family protein [Ostreiculturibacter nitratireducens]|uniref:bestrophin family protein n=1 Tax=Ostreiculturibacter nitratireducens TaxID=3075226 RepID=UPI0031B64AAA